MARTLRTAENPKHEHLPEEDRPRTYAVHGPAYESSISDEEEEAPEEAPEEGEDDDPFPDQPQPPPQQHAAADDQWPTLEGTLIPDAEVDPGDYIPVATVLNNRNYWLGAVLIVVLLLVAIGVIVSQLPSNNQKGGQQQQQQGLSQSNLVPSNVPSSVPSFSPTKHAEEWIYLSQLQSGWSDDGVGVSVAMSRRGSVIAVGAPGYEVNGAIVYKYRDGGWISSFEVDFKSPFELGRSVALDESGSVLAIGAYFGSYFNPTEPIVQNETLPTGKVRVYRIDASLEQIGSDILGPDLDAEFGWSVDISDNGQIVAIGSRAKCLVKVVQFSDAEQDWITMGNDIECSNSSTYAFGSAVSLSGDGSVLAVGDPGERDEIFNYVNTKKGDVSVYRYDEANGGSWRRLGDLIEGEAADDAFGTSVSLSDDGTVIAVGAPFNDHDRDRIYQGTSTLDPSIGSCRVFRYNETSGQWMQKGSNIYGESLFDYFGTAVSLNSDGNYLAVGATGSNDNEDDSGHVRVFEYVEDVDSWVQVGGDIAGAFAYALSGTAVALSSTGDTVTIASPYEPNEYLGFETVGFAQVFETGIVLREGTFPVTITFKSQSRSIRWSLDRLDVERQEIVSIANTRFGVSSRENTTTLMVPEGGVYRFSVFCIPDYFTFHPCSSEAYSIALPTVENAAPEHVIVEGNGNVQTRFQHLFLAREVDFTKANTSGPVSVTLSLDFDDRPEDVHWVLLSTELITTSSPIRRRKAVLGFGSEEAYESEYAWQSYRHVIDVSTVSPNAELQFIFTDDGREENETTNGTSYKIYNGTGRESTENLLLSGTADGSRRKVHSFSLY